MAGERTVLRFYVEANGTLCYQLLTKGADIIGTDLIGLMERAKLELIMDERERQVDYDMTDDEVENVRDLLDKKDDKDAT